MTPYVCTSGDFTLDDLAVLREATAIVDLIPTDFDKGRLLRCHEVARVVGKMLNLRIVDCKYGAMDHTVCLVRPARNGKLKGPSGAVILDPYCPGRLPQVQLVYQYVGAPNDGLYRSTPERDDIRWPLVDKLIAHVGKAWNR